MKNRIAIPLENGKLCSHFGHCQNFAVIDVEDNVITAETLLTPPPHEPGVYPGWLASEGVTEVIAGGMGQRAVDLFTANNIKVNLGVNARTPRELVTDWIESKLETGANKCDH